ncbi:phosphoribosylanthranilate isomerase [Mucilaginibacter daejeonensis]|uniref:phosphoribosylanthranilate isomerase n=1 Tax=Mucilaginibacter daejeonensis TaxID=398049 RepID=UPI001D1716C0|nr:phosphoribosylanthranilate isomerase [Mucilaginibacter daejeonensis]UEG52292.1 phosphoribosylanthranilate isomerase [Mucilaginibacter daejeonensis]
MKIKVCGMRDPANIRKVAALHPDLLGFIFYSRSPRYVGEWIQEALSAAHEPIIKTGVFVNEDIDTIDQLIDAHGLDAVQLHGAESPEVCAALRDRAKVIKAFGVNEQFDMQVLKPYVGVVDHFLFDTKTEAHGGSGVTFDWRVLDSYQLEVPFFLSGGLSLENLESVKNLQHPAFYGVDLNSRFETGPGIKDIDRLRKAFEILRA